METTNKEQILTLKTYLQDYLIETNRKAKGLFNCINEEHTDNNASMSFDKDKNIIHCFGCNKTYDLISLYAKDHNLDNNKDFKRIIDELALKYKVELTRSKTTKQTYERKTEEAKDFTIYYKQVKKDIEHTDYLTDRGISKRLIEKYNIGYDAKEKEIIIPVSKSFYVGRYTNERTDRKHHKPEGSIQEIFNLNYVIKSDYRSVVFVTESIIDALSLEEVNENIKAISLNGVTNTRELIKEAKINKYKGAFILALDTDETGLKTSEELKEDLELVGIRAFIFNSKKEKYNNTKDINEYLLADKKSLTDSVTYFNDTITQMLKKEALQLLEQENTLSYLDTFSEIIKNTKDNQPQPTGIKRLDAVLDGGFFKKNLVILGAISSLGKTTLALQIADNVAKQGQDVLIFSLEMSKEELIAKSISKEIYLKADETHKATFKTLSTRDILKGKMYSEDLVNAEDTIELYNLGFEEYKNNISKHIFITECNEETDINVKNIEARIKKQIEITEVKPLVIIDYLQIIKSPDQKGTDTQIIASIVTELKRVARNNDITILLISAFNRNSYSKEADLSSFRDTSTIEYTADVLISLQPEILDGVLETEDKGQKQKAKSSVNKEQQKDIRALTLKILKNRNGRIKDLKQIDFYAKNNYMDFKEYDANYNRIED